MKRLDLRKTNVARSNTVRDINRQIVLNYVRENGPISRSDIAKKTALQRSTISLIVQELKDFGLINEIYGESSGGRPPVLLTLQTMKPVALGIAIMTDKTTVVTGDLSGRVIDRVEFPTDPDYQITLARIIDESNKFIKRSGGNIEGIGISLPGVVDYYRGIAFFVPHFKWRDLPIVKQLEEATGLSVKADNDANGVALAELWFGHQSEINENRDFITILVKEGIGTGIVFDGQVYQGKNGTAGEFGHMTIGQGAPVTCATGSRECWEAFASERAALARYAKLAGDNGRPNLNIEQLVSLALKGDQNAQNAVKETAHYLGIGIANIIQAMGPESIILAGNITKAWALIEEDLRVAIENCICREYHSTSLIKSKFGDDSNVMGALSLFLASKFATNALN
ncbi:MAG: ROK family transcriptional regulator [Pyrinomonadaceae bacterium]